MQGFDVEFVVAKQAQIADSQSTRSRTDMRNAGCFGSPSDDTDIGVGDPNEVRRCSVVHRPDRSQVVSETLPSGRVDSAGVFDRQVVQGKTRFRQVAADASVIRTRPRQSYGSAWACQHCPIEVPERPGVRTLGASRLLRVAFTFAHTLCRDASRRGAYDRAPGGPRKGLPCRSRTSTTSSVYFEDSGGDGAAVIFSHGFLMDHEMFESQVAALAGEFRCITWDERGFGNTAANRGFTYWDSADDALALLSHLGVDKAFFVGMSQGGFISMARRCEHPIVSSASDSSTPRLASKPRRCARPMTP